MFFPLFYFHRLLFFFSAVAISLLITSPPRKTAKYRRWGLCNRQAPWHSEFASVGARATAEGRQPEDGGIQVYESYAWEKKVRLPVLWIWRWETNQSRLYFFRNFYYGLCLVVKKYPKFFKITRHIESYGIYMEH